MAGDQDGFVHKYATLEQILDNAQNEYFCSKELKMHNKGQRTPWKNLIGLFCVSDELLNPGRQTSI